MGATPASDGGLGVKRRPSTPERQIRALDQHQRFLWQAARTQRARPQSRRSPSQCPRTRRRLRSRRPPGRSRHMVKTPSRRVHRCSRVASLPRACSGSPALGRVPPGPSVSQEGTRCRDPGFREDHRSCSQVSPHPFLRSVDDDRAPASPMGSRRTRTNTVRNCRRDSLGRDVGLPGIDGFRNGGVSGSHSPSVRSTEASDG